MKTSLLFCSIILFTGLTELPRKFPKLNGYTIAGEEISPSYFHKQPTIVILMHLGCPPAMVLVRDLQAISPEKLNGYQVLILTENTKSQVLSFNETDQNEWSDMRLAYGLKPIHLDIVAEHTTGQKGRAGMKGVA